MYLVYVESLNHEPFTFPILSAVSFQNFGLRSLRLALSLMILIQIYRCIVMEN